MALFGGIRRLQVCQQPPSQLRHEQRHDVLGANVGGATLTPQGLDGWAHRAACEGLVRAGMARKGVLAATGGWAGLGPDGKGCRVCTAAPSSAGSSQQHDDNCAVIGEGRRHPVHTCEHYMHVYNVVVGMECRIRRSLYVTCAPPRSAGVSRPPGMMITSAGDDDNERLRYRTRTGRAPQATHQRLSRHALLKLSSPTCHPQPEPSSSPPPSCSFFFAPPPRAPIPHDLTGRACMPPLHMQPSPAQVRRRPGYPARQRRINRRQPQFCAVSA